MRLLILLDFLKLWVHTHSKSSSSTITCRWLRLTHEFQLMSFQSVERISNWIALRIAVIILSRKLFSFIGFTNTTKIYAILLITQKYTKYILNCDLQNSTGEWMFKGPMYIFFNEFRFNIKQSLHTILTAQVPFWMLVNRYFIGIKCLKIVFNGI